MEGHVCHVHTDGESGLESGRTPLHSVPRRAIPCLAFQTDRGQCCTLRRPAFMGHNGSNLCHDRAAGTFGMEGRHIDACPCNEQPRSVRHASLQKKRCAISAHCSPQQHHAKREGKRSRQARSKIDALLCVDMKLQEVHQVGPPVHRSC